MSTRDLKEYQEQVNLPSPNTGSNSSNPLEWLPVRSGTGTKPLEQVFPHENPDRSNRAGSTTKHIAIQVHLFGSNYVS